MFKLTLFFTSMICALSVSYILYESEYIDLILQESQKVKESLKEKVKETFTPHTLLIKENIVKYKLSEKDKEYITKHGNAYQTLPENKEGVFFTTTKWNGNYLKFKNKPVDSFFIIEPEYYYIMNKDTEYFIKDSKLFFMENKIK